MLIIEKIQNKPHAEKIRIIWITVSVIAVLMVVLWAITARFHEDAPKDTTLFKSIDNGIKNIREKKPIDQNFKK